MAGFEIPPIIARNRGVAEITAVAVLALALSVWVGNKARKQREEYDSGVTRLRTVARQVQDVRTSFQPATASENLSLGPADSITTAISHTARVALAQRIAQAAADAGLTGIRVEFTPGDSVSVPSRPGPGGQNASVAPYVLVVECQGGFAKLLTFVNSLPSVVALERIGGAHVGEAASGTTRYHVTLGVYEFGNG